MFLFVKNYKKSKADVCTCTNKVFNGGSDFCFRKNAYFKRIEYALQKTVRTFCHVSP